jgi:hypothetical protein
MQITIELTDHQYKCFTFVERDPEFLMSSISSGRAAQAEEEIVNLTVKKLLEVGDSIPASKEEIVNLGFARGYVKTAEQRIQDSVDLVVPPAVE